MKFPTGFKPKKSLGQSFLVSDKIADKLVSGLQLTNNDKVLEIGAGLGILTTRLCAQAKKVYAVEIDARLIPVLRENTRQYNNIEIINQDIRQLNWNKFDDIKIIGNIPYNISTHILSLLIDNVNTWTLSIVVTQREFTHKLLSLPGQSGYSIYTVLFDFFTKRKKILSLPASVFKPSPKIVSTAVLIEKRTLTKFADINFQAFSQIVGTSFRQPRKTILNNLSMFLGIDKNELTQINQLDLFKRAQDFSVDEFYTLTKCLSQYLK
ncbi:MAG: ribosomal RNA small subunit methyltransferase A [Candidatus Latescibacteria bacterium]|nr:ribosomal RNA small subunit methyltransferase A [Candidatus Latescibacterota bacterium]